MSKPTIFAIAPAATSHPDTTPDAGHNYPPALVRWVRRNPPEPGRLNHLEVMHDAWCGIHHGHRCHCQPEFRWRDESEP